MNADNRLKVLTIPYAQVELLINRDQCSTSVYIAEVRPRKTPCLYLKEGLRLKETLIPLFDLDLFFRDTFKLQPVGEAHLALIREKQTLSPSIQAQISQWEDLFYEEEEPRGDSVALRVASATIMTEVLLSDLRLQPGVLSPVLEEQGLLAVSFPPGGKMEYMLDLDSLLEKKILNARRPDDANSDC